MTHPPPRWQFTAEDYTLIAQLRAQCLRFYDREPMAACANAVDEGGRAHCVICRAADFASVMLTEAAALRAEVERQTALVNEWRIAYDGTDHASDDRAWQAERAVTCAKIATLEAEVARLTAEQ